MNDECNSALELFPSSEGVQKAMEQAFKQLAMEKPNFAELVVALIWIGELSMPKRFARLNPMPPREHLLSMIDLFIAYIRTGKRYYEPKFEAHPKERREPLALQLRALIENWSPPGISDKIVETARALLYADGYLPPKPWDEWEAHLEVEAPDPTKNLPFPEDMAEYYKTLQRSP